MQRLIYIYIVFTIFYVTSCSKLDDVKSDTRSDDPVGGRCEGCEAVYESLYRMKTWTMRILHQGFMKMPIS